MKILKEINMKLYKTDDRLLQAILIIATLVLNKLGGNSHCKQRQRIKTVANLKQKKKHSYENVIMQHKSTSRNLKLISNDGSVDLSLQTLTDCKQSALYSLHKRVKIMLVLIRFVCIIEMKTTFLAQVQNKLLYLSSKMVTFSDSAS